MDNIISKPPIYLAIVWLAVKILLFNLYPDKDLFMVGMGMNVIFIMLIVLLNLRKKFSDNSFLIQFKEVLKPAAFYILLVGISIFVYYQFVDDQFIPNKIELSKTGLIEAVELEGGFEKFKEANPGIKQDTLEDFLKYKSENTPAFLSAQGQALFSVLSMLMLATFLSGAFLVVSRKTLASIPKAD